ncbi:MAG: bifunctional hydroxymethylpyrimidine kinase/phosphomethylpyrimidine kinase [Pyrinomonadaceae bacterium]
MKDKSAIRNPQSAIPKICLTIAGLDPSGGAGIIADIKTFTAFGCFATAAVTSLTFQNTTGVFGVIRQTAESVRGQVEPVLQDFKVAALKTGMLPTREIIEEIAKIIKKYKLKNFFVDPVVSSTSGYDLIDDDALRSLIEKLFPLAEIVMPNIPEAERITRIKINSENAIEKAARAMQNLGARNVLIKGGHFENAKCKMQNAKLARDYLFAEDNLHIFEAEWIETDSTHGTGCTLSAAIAANLANGKNLIEVVEIAKKFVTEAIRAAPQIGHGHSPINHSMLGFRF